MQTDEVTNVKQFIIERVSNRKDINIPGADVDKTVNRLIDIDEEFWVLAESETIVSSPDEIEYIKERTGLDTGLIELVLWQKTCYEMAQGQWEYDAGYCISCGAGSLLMREIPGEDFGEKIVCSRCGTEMILGDSGLEKYLIAKGK